MSSYIGELRSEGYSSLRDTYFETLRTSFPLLGSSQPLQPLDMSQVDLHDHQEDDDGENDESQHEEIDNSSSPPINDNNTETPDHPEPPQTLPTAPPQSLAQPELPPSPTPASKQEQTPTIDNTQNTNISSTIQLSDKQTHNPAESEDLLEFDNESISNEESIESSSLVSVPEGDSTVPGPKETPLSAIPTLKSKTVSHLKAPQNMIPNVKLTRMPDQKSNVSRESSPSNSKLLQPDIKLGLSRESSPSNSKLLQPPISQSKPGQGLYGLELPLLKSIQSSEQYTPSELRSYAVSIIKEGQVNYMKKQDGSTSATLSDLVLKRCKDNSSTAQGDRKKVQRLRTKLENMVCEKDVKEEADKKGRKASESDFGEDDPSLLKSSRLKSPPPK